MKDAGLTFIERMHMSERTSYRLSDDDMDFMPIIPLNEGEGDGQEDTVIPEDLPLLPLRNTVLFPGVVIPITVGRDKSIKAVNEAYKGDKLVGRSEERRVGKECRL